MGRRNMWRLTGPILLLALSAGCGFAPAYRPLAEDAAPRADAAFANPPVRILAEAALVDLLLQENADLGLSLLPATRAADAGPAAILRVSLQEERYGLRSDRAATRAAVRIAGDLLLPDASDAPTTTVPVVAVVPYDVLRSDYATEIARRDALARAGRMLLEQVRAGIARWRAHRSQGGN